MHEYEPLFRVFRVFREFRGKVQLERLNNYLAAMDLEESQLVFIKRR